MNLLQQILIIHDLLKQIFIIHEPIPTNSNYTYMNLLQQILIKPETTSTQMKIIIRLLQPSSTSTSI